jgi:hypothetical protein
MRLWWLGGILIACASASTQKPLVRVLDERGGQRDWFRPEQVAVVDGMLDLDDEVDVVARFVVDDSAPKVPTPSAIVELFREAAAARGCNAIDVGPKSRLLRWEFLRDGRETSGYRALCLLVKDPASEPADDVYSLHWEDCIGGTER